MPRKSESKLDFESWLNSTGVLFSTQLTGEEKLKFLNHVIGLCSATEINEFSYGLRDLLYRDFITLLPTELLCVLLSYFDVKTLLIACQVCRNWNITISGNRQLWKRRAVQWGFRLPEEQHEVVLLYKQLFTQNSLVNWWKHSYDVVELDGHKERVMAIYFHNGRIATGSDDRTVRIWCCQTGQCLSIFATHTVSAIKFDDHFLVTASFDRTAASWDVRTGERLRCYTGHVAAVLCIDFDPWLDILVTGSADGTLKLWSFSKGDLLRTLEWPDGLPKNWICKVCLFCDRNWHDSYSVLAGRNKSVLCWVMDVSSTTVRSSEVLFDCASINQQLIGWEVNDSFLTVMSLVALLSGVKETSYEFRKSAGGRFVVVDSNIFPQSETDGLYWYLGSGKCFSALLFVSDYKDAMLYVVRRTGEIPPVIMKLHSEFRSTRGELDKIVTLCDRQWMDGISSDIYGQTFLAAVFSNDSVRTVTLDSNKNRHDFM